MVLADTLLLGIQKFSLYLDITEKLYQRIKTIRYLIYEVANSLDKKDSCQFWFIRSSVITQKVSQDQLPLSCMLTFDTKTITMSVKDDTRFRHNRKIK